MAAAPPRKRETPETSESSTSSTTSATTAEADDVLDSAPPPWHTVACLVAVFAACVNHLPTLQSVDEIANAITILRVRSWWSSPLIAYAIRLLFGLIMVIDILYVVLWGSWERDTMYYEGSKLRPVKKIRFRGMFRDFPYSLSRGIGLLSAFTRCSWVVQCVAFALLGAIPLLLESGAVEGPDSIPPLVYRLAVVTWEISAPASLLVSGVVKYVLWPMAVRDDHNRKLIRHPSMLLEHNLNSIASLVEVGLLGDMPVRYQDVSLVVLFGMAYVLFAYSMTHRWCDSKIHGPQFMYPFLDTTLPGARPTVALLILLAVLVASFTIFCWADRVLASLGGDWKTHLVAVSLLSGAVCRFRD